MNENIFWTTTAKVKEGQLENLKTLMDELTESTKANVPGALNYEWFISSDEKFCHLFERFEDSATAINHLKLFGKNFGRRFSEALEVKNFTVYGDPSEELTNLLANMGAVLMKPLGGFKK